MISQRGSYNARPLNGDEIISFKEKQCGLSPHDEGENGQNSDDSSSIFNSENEKKLSSSDGDESIKEMIAASSVSDDIK